MVSRILTLFLCVALVQPFTRALRITARPGQLSAEAIRDGDATLIIQADAGIFVPSNITSIESLVYANDTAGLIAFGGSADERIVQAVQDRAVTLTLSSVTARSLTISVRGSNFYAYQAQTLYISVLRPALTQPSQIDGPFTMRVDIPADISYMRRPRQITTGCLALVSLAAAVIGKDTHVGLLSLGRQSLISRLLECDDELDFVLHPTQLSVGNSMNFGCLLMNMSIVILLMVLHTLVLRQFPKLFSPHLPGDHLVFLLAVFAGTTVSTAETVIRTAAPVRWALALVILFMTYLAVIGSLLLTRDPAVVYSDRFRAWGHRSDPNYITRWRVFFKPYRGGLVRWYMLFELVMTAVIAVLTASPQTSQSHSGCFYQSVTVSALVLVDFVVVVFVWPYHTSRELSFAAVLKVVELAVAGESIVATVQDNVNSKMVVAGNALLIFGAVVVLVKYAVALFITARGGEGGLDSITGEYIELMEREAANVDAALGVLPMPGKMLSATRPMSPVGRPSTDMDNDSDSDIGASSRVERRRTRTMSPLQQHASLLSQLTARDHHIETMETPSGGNHGMERPANVVLNFSFADADATAIDGTPPAAHLAEDLVFHDAGELETSPTAPTPLDAAMPDGTPADSHGDAVRQIIDLLDEPLLSNPRGPTPTTIVSERKPQPTSMPMQSKRSGTFDADDVRRTAAPIRRERQPYAPPQFLEVERGADLADDDAILGTPQPSLGRLRPLERVSTFVLPKPSQVMTAADIAKDLDRFLADDTTADTVRSVLPSSARRQTRR
jgi:hypothetical protein